MINIGLGFRFYILYFLLIGTIAWIIVHKSLESVDQSVSQAAEEVMVDTANFLAETLSHESKDGTINLSKLQTIMARYIKRPVNAQIYESYKKHPDMQVYVTNSKGMVIYDSMNRSLGKDFSDWKDVLATLNGHYGARSSSYDPAILHPTAQEKALYIAAPVYAQNNEIIGVLTVYKSVKNLGDFVIQQTEQITNYALITLFFSLIFGAGVTWLLSQSIKKLVDYANALAKGKKAKQPDINQRELMVLSNAIQKMRVELDGKEYVENYIHTMAHELKTPITGVQNAAEILLTSLPEDKKIHFAQHILDSTSRMTLLIDSLLRLAALEQLDTLENIHKFELVAATKQTVASRKTELQNKNITVVYQGLSKVTISGEQILIEQAIANILDNAIDFSPEDSQIIIKLTKDQDAIILQLRDEGTGIPDYALPRIFERFFSLARPNKGKRSSGLGLRFVQEIMSLHQGKVILSNRKEHGVKVCLQFKAQP